jgi:hypothetical protein
MFVFWVFPMLSAGFFFTSGMWLGFCVGGWKVEELERRVKVLSAAQDCGGAA